MFILYINDICNVSKISIFFKFILFADDTNMFYSNIDIVDLVWLTNIELKKLITCMVCSKQVSLNISKTNYMFLVIVFYRHTSIHISKEEMSNVE